MNKLEIYKEDSGEIRVGFEESEGYQANTLFTTDFLNSDFPRDMTEDIINRMVMIYNNACKFDLDMSTINFYDNFKVGDTVRYDLDNTREYVECILTTELLDNIKRCEPGDDNYHNWRVIRK